MEKSEKMSEEERLALAAKLDEDLETFMANLPKRQPSEAKPFDEWQDEILNHPFFMKEVPTDVDGAPVHPLYEGLQKLKYDPNENEPEELALSYKDDGNFNFKHKKYRMAIISYTEGINIKCNNDKLNATLFNNRSAAQFQLGNYRSAILDCNRALKLDSSYEKALVRLASSYLKLEKYEEAIETCDNLLFRDKFHKTALELRGNAVNLLKVKERNARKKLQAERKLKTEQELVIKEILKRKIRIKGGADQLTLTKLEPQFPQLYNSRVFINNEGRLVWPCVFFYPEYKIMDYIQQFDEGLTIFEQLTSVFEETPDWDRERKYRAHSVNVYYENFQQKNIKVDLNSTLLDILQRNDFLVKEGTPSLIILVANSVSEQSFLAVEK